MIFRKANSKSILVQVFLLMSLVVNFACSGPQSKYNTIDVKDPNAGSDYVYGNLEGPPLQANHTYPADENAGARTNAIREKMFGDTQGAEPGLRQGNPGQ